MSSALARVEELPVRVVAPERPIVVSFEPAALERAGPYRPSPTNGPGARRRGRPTGPQLATLVQIGVTAASLATAVAAWSLRTGTAGLAVGAVSAVTAAVLLLGDGHFRVNTSTFHERGPGRVLVAVVAAVGSSAAVLDVVLTEPTVGARLLVVTALLAGAVMAGQLLGRLLLHALWERGRLRAKAAVFGTDQLATEMATEINFFRRRGVDVVALIRPSSSRTGAEDVYAYDATSLCSTLASLGLDRLIIGSSPEGDDSDALRIARLASQSGLVVHALPRLYQMGAGLDSTAPDCVRGYPLVRLHRAAHPQLSLRLKRLVDLVGAATGLLLTAPLIAVAAVAIRRTDGGPILFRQTRIGRYGSMIEVCKLRTMSLEGNGDIEWDPQQRVTRVGHVLRKLNLDELPQLVAVLKGDMSLVGPRPERPAFADKFGVHIPDYGHRLHMPPGLTGLAQIAGLRGDTSISERSKYDNLYVDQWSLRGDLAIMARTLWAIAAQATRSRTLTEVDDALAAVRGQEVQRSRSAS